MKMFIVQLRVRNTISRYSFYALLVMTLSVLSVLSCNKEPNASLPQSIIDLTKNTDCGCAPYIDLYTWRNDATYITSCKGPACLCTVIYYDEKGLPIEMPPLYTFNDFLDEARFERTIWSCGP